MRQKVDALEKATQKLADALYLLSCKPEEHIEGIWHDYVLEFEELLAFARNMEHQIFMRKTAREYRGIAEDIRRLL